MQSIVLHFILDNHKCIIKSVEYSLIYNIDKSIQEILRFTSVKISN